MRYYTFILLILLPLTASSQSKPFASCKLEHRVEPVIDADGTLVKEIDLGWTVSCTITVDNKVIYNRYLPLARPATYRETMEAVERFLKTGSKDIVKQWRETGRPCDNCKIVEPKPISRIGCYTESHVHEELGL